MIKRKRRPRIGDLWLVKKLPPLLFVYTEDGWILHEGDLLLQGWIINEARQSNLFRGRRFFSLTEADKPPVGARRYA